MKIILIGATGRVGRVVLKKLQEEGHTVYAGARKIDNVSRYENVIPFELNLRWDKDKILSTFNLCDAVIFTAGSQGKDLLQTDLYGAVKVMQATEDRGIKRYIHLSGINSMKPELWKNSITPGLTDYYIAKMFSDYWLMDETNLDYTILQPGTLTETKPTGKIDLNSDVVGKNSIDDVATVLSRIMHYDNTISKTISMKNGNTEINFALERV